MRARRIAAALGTLALVLSSRAEQPRPALPVYIDEDAKAAHRIAEARALEAKGRWSEAADAWGTLASEDDAGLCEVSPGLFRSPSEVAEERLRAIPRDAAPEASERLSSLASSRIVAARTALEEARAVEALSLLREGSDSAERVLLLARALAASGEARDAEALVERVHARTDSARLGEVGLPLGLAVQRILSRVPKEETTSSWATPPAVFDVPPIEGPLVCSRETSLAGPRSDRSDAADLRDRMVQAQLASAGAPTFCPAAAGGLVILRDGEKVVATAAADGRVRWADRSFPVRCPVHLVGGRVGSRPACALWSPVLEGGRVWLAAEAAVEGFGFRRRGAPAPRRVRLVALDASDGHAVFDSDSLGDEWLSHATLASAPLVRGGVAYVLASQAGAEEQVHLLAIDPARGKVLWNTFLFAMLGGPSHLFDWALGSSAIGALAEGRGSIYIGSNAGLVLCVDRASGRPRWARAYDAASAASARVAVDDCTSGWAANPLLVEGERLLVAPTDGNDLLALRADDGALLAKVPSRGRRYLLGAMGDLAYVAGSDVACVDLVTGEERWQVAVEGKPFGRGFLTPTGVYHATDQAIVCLRPEDGSLLWGPCTWTCGHVNDGVLLPLGEGILSVAGPCVRFGIPRKVFDREMAEKVGRAPEDAALVLSRGEAYERGGFEEEALSDYLSVIGREVSRDLQERARTRAFALLAGRAGRLDATRQGEQALAAWKEALRVTARDAEAFLARVRIAALLDRLGDGTGAAAAWQEVLSRHTHEVLEEGETRRSGAALAIAGIDRLRERYTLAIPSVRPSRTGRARGAVPAGKGPDWEHVVEAPPLRGEHEGLEGPEERIEGDEAEEMSLLPVEGDLVVRSGKRIACVEPASGAVRWMSFLSHAKDPAVARADGGAIVVQEPDRIASIDATTGKMRWEIRAEEGAFVGRPSTSGDSVVFETGSPSEPLQVSCVDAALGKVRWRVSASTSARASVQVGSGEVILSDEPAGAVSVLDLASGTERFARRGHALLPGGGPLAGTMLAAGRLIVREGARTLRAFDLDTGEAAWEASFATDVRAVAADGDAVAASLAGGRLRVLTSADGKDLLDQDLGFDAEEAVFQGDVLAVAGAKGERWRLVLLRREKGPSFALLPALDIDSPGGVNGFRLAEGFALVETAASPGPGEALTAWRLGPSEAVWQETFPEGRARRLRWTIAGGVLAAESEGVLRRFGPAEDR